MVEPLSDATLLRRFVSDREEAAFAVLVRRHAPRVERICRRILRNEHDVEDVLQATFLVLARKAAAIPWRDSVSPWLDGVARRLAMHARSDAARLRLREATATTLNGESDRQRSWLPECYHPEVEPSVEVEQRDLRRVLDDELLRLPEKYRAPLVLCDLEGHTREEAARRLGWPCGSMSRRLDRGRSLLRQRLTGRGVTLAILGMATLAVAAFVGREAGRGQRTSSVRPVMATFRPVADGGDGYGAILAEAARGENAHPDLARILPAARAAAEAARRIEGQGPSGASETWDRLAASMRRSALELERACEQSDTGAVIAAARRLDASCVRCHAAFRRPAGLGDGEAVRVSFRRPLPERHRTHRSRASRHARSPASVPNDSIVVTVIRMGHDRDARPFSATIPVAALLADRRSQAVAREAAAAPGLSRPC